MRSTTWPLIAIAVVFLAMWMLEDVPATVAGEAPDTVSEIGLVTNPVHVLDTAFLLPACILAGVLLLRRRDAGFVLAPVLLVALAVIGVGIVVIMLVAIAGGETRLAPVAGVMALVSVLQAWLAWRFLRHLA